MATALCCFYYAGLLARDDMLLKSQMYSLAMWEPFLLTIGEFFLTVCYGVVSSCGSAKLRYRSGRIGMA